jgi:signal peptide peptidase SppA
MKLAKILSVLKDEPAFCMPGYRLTLLEIFQQHAELSKVEYQAKRVGKDSSGSNLDVEQMEKRGNVAIIPVGGPIGQGFDAFEKGAGCVDVDDLKSELLDADGDDEIENIIMNFDTPGGMVTGTPELGEFIKTVEKPVYAFTRGQMCSAGYWLAASCDGIFSTKSADIGCIGVCCSFLDLSKLAEMQGIKVKVFGSGDYKGMGTPGTSLTPKQEILIQQRIMSLADMFYSHVRSERGQISDADMQGQTFKGQEALDKGFIDDLMPDLDALVSFLK